MDLDLFDYNLPKKFIAQKPLAQRNHSKLMVLDRHTGEIKHEHFYNIGNYLRKNDCLVINESRVIKCRLFGRKEMTGGKVECFVLEKIVGKRCLALLRPSKRLRKGSKVKVGKYQFEVVEKKDSGKAIVEFNGNPEKIFEEEGNIPLPPYIKRNNIEECSYQTVYAKKKGSVAAPTAGLHFTSDLMDELIGMGIIFAKVSLNIGIDTFRPVKEENIEDHNMHSEYFTVSAKEVGKIREAKKRGGRIIAVGTTAARALETLMGKYGKIKPFRGKTSLYIYPGYKFKAVEAMVTNFHLPRSTLIIMVAAFAGRKRLLQSYEVAKKNGYRFFSFGDCMFIH
ncbi:MAG: tRNA preQ1(34) S-adenosylmethionine ribosyltransferase-isomerase QueA [Candidatus Humimicrobiaceae bacterium]